MSSEQVFLPAETAIFFGVLIALLLFVRMAASAGTARSLQFQLSAFLIVWAVAELPTYLSDLGLIDLDLIEVYGLLLHTVSMILFAAFIVFRFSKFVLRSRGSTPHAN